MSGNLACFCLCGETMRGSAKPQSIADYLIATFWRFHAGTGHGPTTATVAMNARRRASRRLAAVASSTPTGDSDT